ncbi:ketopantoate reductase C-terminal domain-containing protein, partial [Nocardia farcinica]|uniref:ketopantoate reductase C-terminal domain-containing protein n=1 Tax=Nocardia farcinica TaxID=37329 RepID=UPI003CC7FB3F
MNIPACAVDHGGQRMCHEPLRRMCASWTTSLHDLDKSAKGQVTRPARDGATAVPAASVLGLTAVAYAGYRLLGGATEAAAHIAAGSRVPLRPVPVGRTGARPYRGADRRPRPCDGNRSAQLDPHARSSMADDLAAGRRTEITWLCGEIVDLGAMVGVRAP